MWLPEARSQYDALKKAARSSLTSKDSKSSKQAGVFKQVHKALGFLASNPRHPSLNSHRYNSLTNPYDPDGKVFEVYAQNDTPGTYRIFWCYGPNTGEISILTVTPHP